MLEIEVPGFQSRILLLFQGPKNSDYPVVGALFAPETSVAVHAASVLVLLVGAGIFVSGRAAALGPSFQICFFS